MRIARKLGLRLRIADPCYTPVFLPNPLTGMEQRTIIQQYGD